MGNHVGRHFALLLLLSLIIKVAVPQLCSVQDEELLKRRRVQGLRAHILAQLGMKEPLPIMNATTPKPEILEAYKALTEATEAREREREKCQSDEFLNFAQPVNSFVGTIVPVPISSEGGFAGSVKVNAIITPITVSHRLLWRFCRQEINFRSAKTIKCTSHLQPHIQFLLRK